VYSQKPNPRFGLYRSVKAAVDNNFGLRRELVLYAQAHGIRAAARRLGCARNTVRLWLRRFATSGNDGLADRSRRPHRQPRRCTAKAAEAVIAARKRAPCFGARRLVESFALPVGKGAAHRVLRDAGLLRQRQKKHRRKADLRRIKANHPPLRRWQMDTKYLDDIPHYWPQMQAQSLPRFQYTLRDEATGAVLLAYASELSKTFATLASARLLEQLQRFGIPLTELEVRTDLGTEFDGDTRHFRPDGFHGQLRQAGVYHRFNPPQWPNANADVESFHATIEAEFFDIESFHGPAHFQACIATYQTWFNFARNNRSRGNRAPAQILAQRAPSIDPRVLLLPAIILSDPNLLSLGQDLSGPPAFGGLAGTQRLLGGGVADVFGDVGDRGGKPKEDRRYGGEDRLADAVVRDEVVRNTQADQAEELQDGVDVADDVVQSVLEPLIHVLGAAENRAGALGVGGGGDDGDGDKEKDEAAGTARIGQGWRAGRGHASIIATLEGGHSAVLP
jgi:transposase